MRGCASQGSSGNGTDFVLDLKLNHDFIRRETAVPVSLHTFCINPVFANLCNVFRCDIVLQIHLSSTLQDCKDQNQSMLRRQTVKGSGNAYCPEMQNEGQSITVFFLSSKHIEMKLKMLAGHQRGIKMMM